MIPAGLVAAFLPTFLGIIRKGNLEELATDAAGAIRPVFPMPDDRARLARLLRLIAEQIEPRPPHERPGAS